jgi:L-lysine 6-transaminase
MIRASQILRIIKEDNLIENAAETGKYLQMRLTELAKRHPVITNVRGHGMLTAFNFPDSVRRDRFITKGFEHNVMFIGCGESAIRFRPALIMQPEHVDAGMEVMERIVPFL